MAGLRGDLARGAAIGLWAGVPQVLIVQVEERLLGLEDDKADIGPRFVQRAAAHMGESAPPATKWALAAAFHFLYSAGWECCTRSSSASGRRRHWSAGPRSGR